MVKSQIEENIIGSPIQEFFRGKTIFLTGGTGFMGKILVEKILRSCPHVSRIYMLVRPKKNKDPQQRMQEYVEEELFQELSAKARLKISGLSGDVSLPRLGLSQEHRQMLEDTVHVVFHAAATVRFNEQLPAAVAINVSGTSEMFDLARNMKQLEAFIHVSTAFSNCHVNEIREEFYEPPTTLQKLIKLTQSIEGHLIDQITPIILDHRPNTYVYTKAVAEEIVRTQGKGLPVSIFRPAIVIATDKEPIRGWVDNLYGPSGVLISLGTGVLRTLHCDGDVIANIVPVDNAVNAMIAIAWKTANRTIEDTIKNGNEPTVGVEHEEPTVYNYVSSTQRPITWREFVELAIIHCDECPPMQAIWCCCLTLNKHFLIHYLYVLFLHFLPAIIMDFIATVFGNQTGMLAIYKKINKSLKVLCYFTTRYFTFYDDNVQSLWRVLSPQDKEIFPFDLSKLDWNEYFHYYIRGIRKHLMKDDPATIPRAKSKYRIFKFLHRSLKLIVAFLLLRLLWSCLPPFLSSFLTVSQSNIVT